MPPERLSVQTLGSGKHAYALSISRSRGDDLIGAHEEALEDVGAESRGNRDVRRVAAARDENPADAGRVVAGVERVPATSEEGIEPAREIHRPGHGPTAHPCPARADAAQRRAAPRTQRRGERVYRVSKTQHIYTLHEVRKQVDGFR